MKKRPKDVYPRFARLLFALLALTITTISQSAAPNRAAEYDEKEIQFTSGALILAGTVLLPRGEGPFPAVVIVHGSGNSDRSNPWTAAYAKALAQRGVAVLHPDKRGAGKSQGDWRTTGFTALADDVLAGVAVLRQEPKIDKARIGVIGFSQGGHIVAAVAARAAQIAFAISISGSVVPILEQTMDEIESGAERAGLTISQIELLKDINRKGIQYALTGQGWNEYQATLNAAKAGTLKGQKMVEAFPTTPDHWSVGFVRAVGDFDPILYWRKSSIPMLFGYGGQDTQVKVHKSIRRLEEAFRSEKRNLTVLLFNSNGHAFYREDFLAFLARWIVDRGIG